VSGRETLRCRTRNTSRQLGENPRILPASRVAKEVVHALSSSNPKTRYLVGPGAKKAAKLARMPVWLRDWLISRFMSSGIRGIIDQTGR